MIPIIFDAEFDVSVLISRLRFGTKFHWPVKYMCKTFQNWFAVTLMICWVLERMAVWIRHWMNAWIMNTFWMYWNLEIESYLFSETKVYRWCIKWQYFYFSFESMVFCSCALLLMERLRSWYVVSMLRISENWYISYQMRTGIIIQYCRIVIIKHSIL